MLQTTFSWGPPSSIDYLAGAIEWRRLNGRKLATSIVPKENAHIERYRNHTFWFSETSVGDVFKVCATSIFPRLVGRNINGCRREGQAREHGDDSAPSRSLQSILLA